MLQQCQFKQAAVLTLSPHMLSCDQEAIISAIKHVGSLYGGRKACNRQHNLEDLDISVSLLRHSKS